MANAETRSAAKQIETTGDLRRVLTNAIKGVLNGDLDIEEAMAVHRLSKNVAESLYSETKIAMFQKDCGKDITELGALPLHGPVPTKP